MAPSIRANIGVDFVFPDSANLSDYKVIVVPPLYVASDALLNHLAEYVKNGGHLVLAFKSGFSNEYSIRSAGTMMPGPLQRRRRLSLSGVFLSEAATGAEGRSVCMRARTIRSRTGRRC